MLANPSWLSNPPSETKNTWRFAPTSVEVLIMRATSLSWSANPFPVGNTVLIAGPPASAVVSASPATSERDITRVYSFSNRCVRGAVTSVCNAAEQVAEPNSGFLTPLSAAGPLGETWYCTAVWPDRNTALLDTLTQVKVALPLPASNKSPMRPPQPEVAPSGADDCQTDCWSLWENNLGGSGTDFALYCAFVVGCTSVPTFNITASRLLVNSGSSGASSGASAYWMPPGSAVVGVSSVGVRALRA